MSDNVRVVSNIPQMQRMTDKALKDTMEFILNYAAREAVGLTSRRFFPPASKASGSVKDRAPAMRTQVLTQSIKDFEPKKDSEGWVGIFGTTVDYGRFLELGTTDMAPRPFLRPALDKTIKEVPKALRKAFGKRYRISGGIK